MYDTYNEEMVFEDFEFNPDCYSEQPTDFLDNQEISYDDYEIAKQSITTKQIIETAGKFDLTNDSNAIVDKETGALVFAGENNGTNNSYFDMAIQDAYNVGFIDGSKQIARSIRSRNHNPNDINTTLYINGQITSFTQLPTLDDFCYNPLVPNYEESKELRKFAQNNIDKAVQAFISTRLDRIPNKQQIIPYTISVYEAMIRNWKQEDKINRIRKNKRNCYGKIYRSKKKIELEEAAKNCKKEYIERIVNK